MKIDDPIKVRKGTKARLSMPHIDRKKETKKGYNKHKKGENHDNQDSL